MSKTQLVSWYSRDKQYSRIKCTRTDYTHTVVTDFLQYKIYQLLTDFENLLLLETAINDLQNEHLINLSHFSFIALFHHFRYR